MKTFKLFLAIVFAGLLPVLVEAAPFLAWTAPTTNTDGSPLTDLASFNVYRCQDGVAVCDKATNGQLTTTIPAGTITYDLATWTTTRLWFVTAVDTAGNESAESNCIKANAASVPGSAIPCFVDTLAPNAPSNVRVQ